MSGLPFGVGEKVLVSREETGDDHEPATVVDAYELIIGDDRRPMITVEFEDGERKYLKATPPHVLPGEPEEEDEGEGAEAEPADADVEADDEVDASASLNGDGAPPEQAPG
jgi:hypothetical protein